MIKYTHNSQHGLQILYLTKCTWVEVQDFQLHQKNPSDFEVFARELPAENSNKLS